MAAVALVVLGATPVLVGELEFAEEANDLVAVHALLRLERELFADHARGLFHEFLLELADLLVRVQFVY